MKYLLAFLLIAGLSHGQGSIKDEFKNKKPYPYPEIVRLRLNPISDPDLTKRLVRVEDNFEHALDPYWDNPDKGLRIPEVFWGNYAEIYRDKKDGAYYAGIFRRAADDEIRGLKKINWGRPIHKTNRHRIAVVSNLSSDLSLIADAADWGELYIRKIVPTYDFYKGYLSAWGSLYDDPENKNPLKMEPITNKKTGGLAYKGISPNTGRVFYSSRWLRRRKYFGNDVEEFGELMGISDTLEEIWERQKPEEPVNDI